MRWSELVGKKVVGLRGWSDEHGRTPLGYILFDDGQTFIELDEQDRYAFHDCSSSARELTLRSDAKFWKEMYEQTAGWRVPDDVVYPFARS